MIFVFLSNKLITLDTILPLLLEFKERAPDLRFEFICFEPSTEAAIRQNTVLYDVLKSLGRLRMLGRNKKGPLHTIAHRFSILGPMARIALWLLHPRTRLLHFKALNSWPLRLLAWMAPQRTIFAQGSAVGFAEVEKRVSEAMKPRNYVRIPPAGKHIVMFSEHWPWLDGYDLADRAIYRLAPPFTLHSWVCYVQKNKDHYLDQALEAAGFEPGSEFGVAILNWLGPSPLFRIPEDTPKLLGETLEVLREACPELPIMIKPHPATRPRELAILNELLKRFSQSKLVVTHLHPMVLAMRARFVIGNNYSTTFSTFKYCGVPSIEYSDYAEAILKETSGGSMRPEIVTYFINRDKAELQHVLKRCASTPRAAAKIKTAPAIPADVFAALAGMPPLATVS